MELKGKISLYKDGNKTIVVIDDTVEDMPRLVSNLLYGICQQELPVTEITGLNPVAEKNEEPVIRPDEEFTPDFLTAGIENTDESAEDTSPAPIENNLGDHIVTMNGKYKVAGLTISEIYAKDSDWLKWIAEKSVSKHSDVAKIKEFMAMQNK